MSAYRKILVAVDGSAASNKGLREAVRLARTERARLFIVHVVHEFQAFAAMDGLVGAPGADLLPALRESGKRVLAKAKKTADRAGVRSTALLREMLSGPAAYLGTHGRRGVRRLVLGSDAEQVVRTASVPVLLVRT